MKKLFLSEAIATILAIGLFTLLFTLLGGWEMSGQERYNAAVATAVVVAIAVGVVGVVVVAIIADVPFAVVDVAVAVAAAVVVVGVAAVVDVAVGVLVAAAVVVGGVLVVVLVALIVFASIGAEEIDASKKTIWLSLSAEAIVIAAVLLGITFSGLLFN